MKIEKFLRSHIYLLLVTFISFIIWSLRYYVDATLVTTLSFNGLFFLSIPLFFILLFLKNTIYTIPIIMVALFTLGLPTLDISTLDVALSGFINAFIVILGFIIHFIKFKPELKLKRLGLSLGLASISFAIPLLYTEITGVGIFLTILIPFYLIVYLFYANTIKTNELNYLMKTFVYVSLMLTVQLITLLSDGLTDFSFLYNIDALKDLTFSSPLWGNVNDLTIQLVLMSSATIYFLNKKTSLLPWLYLGWIGFWIVIANARGSVVTISVFALIVVIHTLLKGSKRQKLNFLIICLVLGIFLIFIRDIVGIVFESFFGSIDFNDANSTLTGRITLWFHEEFGAFTLFKKYPIFGNGFNTPKWFLSVENRVTVYHSTFFHVLATGGVVGIGILIYQFICIAIIFIEKHRYIAVSSFLITYLLTQFHGLIDNTQYMIHFSIVTYIAFAVIENARDDNYQHLELEIKYM